MIAKYSYHEATGLRFHGDGQSGITTYMGERSHCIIFDEIVGGTIFSWSTFVFTVFIWVCIHGDPITVGLDVSYLHFITLIKWLVTFLHFMHIGSILNVCVNIMLVCKKTRLIIMNKVGFLYMAWQNWALFLRISNQTCPWQHKSSKDLMRKGKCKC